MLPISSDSFLDPKVVSMKLIITPMNHLYKVIPTRSKLLRDHLVRPESL